MDWFAVGTNILRDPRTWAFAHELNMNPAHAAGHLLGVYALLAVSGDASGRVDSLVNDHIEDAALWRGKKGRFAAAFRTHYQDEDGTLRNWKSWNGADIARAKAERQRKRDARRAAKMSAGPSADAAQDAAQNVRARGNGAARVPDLTRPDQLLTTPESPVGDRGGWVAEAVRRWAAQVGVVTHGRMGKALRPAVALYGEAAVLEAIDRFGAWRSRRDPGPRGELPGLPQFVATIRTHIPPTMLAPAAGEAS